ncbi:MAG: septum formation initiator family protein [Acidobacteria bacterium]|nr:septum formation initiator family protein [Acidobacteriota bacterium]
MAEWNQADMIGAMRDFAMPVNLQMQALDEEVERLKEDNRRLAQKIQGLRSDPQAIEELARKQLRMARPGEVVVTLPPEEQPEAPSLDGSPFP